MCTRHRLLLSIKGKAVLDLLEKRFELALGFCDRAL